MQKTWAKIGEISSSSGIYAWYYIPKLSDRDINETIHAIEAAKKTGDLRRANDSLTRLLDNGIFSNFQETQYEVHLKGRLKANYAGEVMHVPSISSTLIDRIVDNPKRLWGVKDILLRVAPSFSSPLYIGMAKSLRSRLASHKALIEAYRLSLIHISEPTRPY